MTDFTDDDPICASQIRKIVSGGQTGADRGALYAARDEEVPIGGWIPRGARAEDGRVPERLAEHLQETESTRYETRTRRNVRDADATLIVSLGAELTGGSLLTWNIADAFGRPCRHVQITRDGIPVHDRAMTSLVQWIRHHEIGVLNVAGPRESKEPGVQDATYLLVKRLLWCARIQQTLSEASEAIRTA
jgi:hypothetical protein